MLELEIAPKLIRNFGSEASTQAKHLLPNTIVQGKVVKIIKEGHNTKEIQISANKILAFAHSGNELYLPHKKDLVFYDGQAIVVSRLNWSSD